MRKQMTKQIDRPDTPIEDEENTDQEDTTEEDGVDLNEAKVIFFGELLSGCFDAATKVIELAELSEGAGALTKLKAQLVLSAFNKTAREIPDISGMFEKALEYLHILMEEKVASDPPCKHPIPRLLYEAFIQKGKPHDFAVSMMESMKIVTEGAAFVIACPECSESLPIVAIKSGILWDLGGE